MELFIDNKNLNDYGIIVLDYTGALSFPAERVNERVWQDKSGVDKNLENIRYDSKEFVLKLIVKADSEVDAYNIVQDLVTDMFTRGNVVLSLRDSAQSIRECYLVERSNVIVGDIKVRDQNGLYVFKLGLKDVNPNAVKYKTTIAGNEVTILYDKGQTAVIYWGDGDRGEVSNSGNYIKDDYLADGLVDIIIDIDADTDTIAPLIADFMADVVSGVESQEVQFSDLSSGSPELWSWDFGDNGTSDEQDPLHTYEEAGTYTVTLQIFNEAKGSDVEIKIDYITVRKARLMINSSDFFIINDSGDKLLKN